MLWRHRSEPVANVRDIASIIQGLTPHETIVRGEIHDDVRDEPVLRRKGNFGGPIRSKESTPRQYLVVDMDDLPKLSHHDDAEDPEIMIEWAISEYLPPEFHDASCYWRLSASAGNPDKLGVSCHIWFWVDRPIIGGDLASYFAAYAPHIDCAPFGDKQPVYSIPPIFKNFPDPLPRRDGIMEREKDHVTLPRIDAKELKRTARTHAPTSELGDVAGCLAVMGRGEGLQGFHAPLLRAVWLMVHGGVEEDAILERCMAAIKAAPQNSGDAEHYDARYIMADIESVCEKREADWIEINARPDRNAVSIGEGERRVRAFVREFLEESLRVPAFVRPALDAPLNEMDVIPPVWALLAELGLGKSQILIEELIKFSRENPELRIHFHVPSTSLVDEVVARFTAAGGSPRWYRGRTRKEKAYSGAFMCHDDWVGKIKEFTAARIPVTPICKICPHKDDCGSEWQRKDDAPGIVVLPAAFAFQALTNTPDIWIPDVQIFDEDPTAAALSDSRIRVSDLLKRDVFPVPNKYLLAHERGEISDAGLTALRDDIADRVAFARGRVLDAITTAGDGEVTLDGLRDVGVAAYAAEVMGVEYQRADVLKDRMHPGMKIEQLKRIRKNFEGTNAWGMAAMWRSIMDQVGKDRTRWHAASLYSDDGENFLKIGSSKTVTQTKIPTLLSDGTLNETTAARVFPYLTRVDRIAVDFDPEHVKIIQVTDRPVSMAMLAPDEDSKDYQRQKNNCDKLARLVEVITAAYGTVGLITYKATETELGGKLPAGTVTGHFGNVRGSNDFEKVRVLISAGRLLASERDTEFQAEQIHHDSYDEIIPGKYGHATASRIVAGELVPSESLAHPDPTVEGVRHNICENELYQVAHRGRLIRRTAKNPLLVILLTDVVQPFPVDHVTTWDEIIPNRFQVATARTGVTLTNHQDIADAHPDLFSGKRAVERAAERVAAKVAGPCPRAPILTLTIGGRGQGRREARYQRAGQGKRHETVQYNPEKVHNIKAWLTDRVGPLKKVETDSYVDIDFSRHAPPAAPTRRVFHTTERNHPNPGQDGGFTAFVTPENQSGAPPFTFGMLVAASQCEAHQSIDIARLMKTAS